MKNLTDKVRNSVGIALVGTGLSTLCVFEYKLISNMLTKQQYSHNPLSLAQDIVIYGMAGINNECPEMQQY